MAGQLEDNLLQKLCEIHDNRQCVFICTDPGREDNVFKCDYCVAQDSLQGKRLIPIEMVQTCVPKTIFFNWPLPGEDELMKQIEDASQKKNSSEIFTEQIVTFFEELRKQIEIKIKELQVKLIERAREVSDFGSTIVKAYNKISEKDYLRQQLSQESNDPELSNNIRKKVKDVIANTDNNKQELQQLLNELLVQETSFSLEKPIQIRNNILAALNKIDMFEIKPNDELAGNSKLLFDLATNKLNFVSDGFSNKLQGCLKSVMTSLEPYDLNPVYIENKQRLKLEVLTQEELNEIEQQAQVKIASHN